MVDMDKISVEVAYARPDKQVIVNVRVPGGTAAKDAILESGILDIFPEIDLDNCKIGIFGKLVKPDRELSEGDRVEIYRPLLADPKAVRKKRASVRT